MLEFRSKRNPRGSWIEWHRCDEYRRGAFSSEDAMVMEGELLWTPRPEFAAATNLAKYQKWLSLRRGNNMPDYTALWQWSVSDIEDFWTTIWDFFKIEFDGHVDRAVQGGLGDGTRWFSGARVNYAEHMLRAEAQMQASTALYHSSECRPLRSMSWSELGGQVRKLATLLRELGIKPGDRVVAYLPNIPEAAIAMLATTSIGAVWSSAAIEFGVTSVIDRFAQIEPKVLFVADGYMYGGVSFAREQEAQLVSASLPTLKHVFWVPHLKPAETRLDLPGKILWSDLASFAEVPRDKFVYERVAYDHPLWIVFSSGTTGLPKPIVHGHVGILLEHLKVMHFHINLQPHSVMLFYSTTGWMMWNILLAALLTGAAAVLYDGNPTYPGPEKLWSLAADTGATCLGASPTFVQTMQKAGLRPGAAFGLTELESIVISGAPSTPETFDWFYKNVKEDLWVTSQSGGTEICSALVGGVPTLPVYAGEMQARALGMDVHAWDENGHEVRGLIGELVVTKPCPSMPIFFWNDVSGERYREAYFNHFPGAWRHGDFLRINERGGCYISGRSDSVLNRNGVRIGTAEIYRVLEQIEEVADSLVVCCEVPQRGFFMPLFVRLTGGRELTETLRLKIAADLRRDCSPRHVPDRMYAVPDIPYTLSGKKMEIPVRRILMGTPPEAAANRDAMRNPAALDWYSDFAQRVGIYRGKINDVPG
jgi:acetoacetyl-CoA synthetase